VLWLAFTEDGSQPSQLFITKEKEMSNLLNAMLNARYPGVNMDEEGIHYGVIPKNALSTDIMWCGGVGDALQDAEMEMFEANWVKGRCLFDALVPDIYWKWKSTSDEGQKEELEVEARERLEVMEIDITDVVGAVEFVYEGVTMISSDELLFVKNSPHKGMYALCSPCMPNAGNLMEPDKNEVETHDVPKEWRRDHE